MRYQRQEKIIGKQGQQKLVKAHLVVVGVGAIGTVVAELATRAGVGKITLIDRDIVELNNLQRQVLFTERDVGMPKAYSAASHLKEINKEVRIKSYARELNNSTVSLLKGTIILDCTDNLVTRFLINEYAAQKKIPWIYAGAIRTLATVFPVLPGKPCFRCFQRSTKETESCETSGVLATATITAATLQFNMALKLLLGEKVASELQRVDVWHNNYDTFVVKKRKDCPVTQKKYEYLTQRKNKAIQITALCGGLTYQIKGKQLSITTLAKKLGKKGKVKQHKDFFQYKNLLVFVDGRVIIQTSSEKKALEMYEQIITL